MTYWATPALIAILIQDRHHESLAGGLVDLVPVEILVIDDTKVVTKSQFR